MRRRSRAGLSAAISILGTTPVELRDVAELIAGMTDIRYLRLVRNRHLEDDCLWEDANAALVEATRAPVTPDAPGRLGTCLAIVEALLSVPEAARAATVGMRAMA